jgi:DNA polymerase V
MINPRLSGKPVVVLSSNDEIIVALSPEAKALGLKRGDVKYKVMHIIRQNKVHYLSSNGDFYDDISDRVMTEITKLVPDISVYSCDEAFANLYGLPNIPDKALEIKNTILKNTGIPVSQGIAETKVLCKIANRFVKRFPQYNGIGIIDTEVKRINALKKTDVSNIWGIGPAYSVKLNSKGVKTAYDLILKPRSFVRTLLSVVGERIWCELQGEPYIITDMPEVKVTPGHLDSQ